MKKNYFTLTKIALTFIMLSVAIVVQSQEILKITLAEPPVLDPGETIELTAEYTNDEGKIETVKIKWHTDPGYLGEVVKDNELTANHPGEGFLFVKYKELRDSIKLVVNGTPKGNDDDGEETEDDYPKVKVIPGSIKVAIGDSVELRAFYINELDEKIDTFFTWSVESAELGEFPYDTVSMFYAYKIGEGTITATLGDLADTIKLTVIENKQKPNNNNSGKQMVIIPGDTVVNADAGTIQYSAIYKVNGNKQDAEIQWSVSDEEIATIDSEGLLTLTGETGMTIVSATYSNFRASTELLVIDPGADVVVNSISIHRVLPNGNELKARTFKEGESYKIGGLPFPLNILNAGMIHFPFGCIDEDIVIYMFIPEEYADVDEEDAEVTFDEGIITGVKFSVKPVGSDDIVEPYYFINPINLRLVYKRGLLDSLNIKPENLDVFFAENTEFIKDDDGNVAIDTAKNRIYAKIEHFSTIVVKQKSAETFVKEFEDNSEESFTVFPNPFSSSTQILYKVSRDTKIELAIYNLFGQKIKELVNEEKPLGTHSVIWDGRNETGSLATTGIYFCRIVKGGNETQIKRVILNR